MKELYDIFIAACTYFTFIALLGVVVSYLADIFCRRDGTREVCWNPIKKVNKFVSGFTEGNEKYKEKEKVFKTVVWAVILVGLFHFVGPMVFAKPEIGAYFETSEYKAQYYVRAYPGYYDDVTSYRLPADIWKYNEPEIGKRYFVGKVYFPNGGYMDFQYDEAAEVGEKIAMVNSNGEHWYIELTKDKVK